LGVESAADFIKEEFEVQGLVSFVGGALADWANEAFVAAGWIDADEVEDFSIVEISLVAFEVAYS